MSPVFFAERPQTVDTAPTFDEPVSQLVTAAQICSARFETWRQFFQWGFGLNRKLWEYLYILNALDSYCGLGEGKTGIGFGVGRERLVPLLASKGCRVTATDYVAEAEKSLGWESRTINDLVDEQVCPKDTFLANVSFRDVDMNAIPDDLRNGGADFLWSCGSLEHIGGLQHGLDFIQSAMACLRPGGIAVHTTEFNIVSNERTLDSPSMSFYRRQDIEGLAHRLRADGHQGNHGRRSPCRPGAVSLSPVDQRPGRRVRHHLDRADHPKGMTRWVPRNQRF